MTDRISGALDVLYHYTSLHAAAQIMTDNEFSLSPIVGTGAELDLGLKNLYFLSTSRIKFGGYARSQVYKFGVTLNLDGRKLSHKYSMSPVDYWGREWRESMKSNGIKTEEILGKNENEERVFIDQPYIPAKPYITEIHIFVTPDPTEWSYTKAHQNALKIISAAKKSSIPVYLYDDLDNFKLQNVSKSLSYSDLPAPEKEEKSKPYYRGEKERADRTFDKYLELYYATDVSKLSKEANRLAYNLTVGGMYLRDIITSLENDIHNSRSTKNKFLNEKLYRLLKLLQKHKTKNIKEFVELVLIPKAQKLMQAEAGSFSLQDDLRDKYSEHLMYLDIFDLSSNDALELKLIELKPESRGLGIGSEIMREILAYADKHAKIIVLSPHEVKKAKLKKWYRSLGFQYNKGRNKDFRFMNSMIRYPKGLTRSKWIDNYLRD